MALCRPAPLPRASENLASKFSTSRNTFVCRAHTLDAHVFVVDVGVVGEAGGGVY